MSLVYIAPLLNKTAFKVGKSEDPKDRLSQLSRFYEFDPTNILLVDCKCSKNAYNIESLFHSICNKQRVILENDGGTEFFSYDIYNKFISIVNNIVELHQYTISHLVLSQQDLLNINEIKTDDVSRFLNALSIKLKNKRLEYNISRIQLSKISGVNVPNIKRFETIGQISLKNFIGLLKSLNLDYLLSEFEVEKPDRLRGTNDNIMSITSHP